MEREVKNAHMANLTGKNKSGHYKRIELVRHYIWNIDPFPVNEDVRDWLREKHDIDVTKSTVSRDIAKARQAIGENPGRVEILGHVVAGLNRGIQETYKNKDFSNHKGLVRLLDELLHLRDIHKDDGTGTTKSILEDYIAALTTQVDADND